MEKEYGAETTHALARLPATGALTQPQAEHILSLVYPGVPNEERIRCAILCRDFGLHPLMKEVYIIPFKNKAGGNDYATVIGITANRKMAADKKGAFSFLDDSPRAASEKEVIKQYGPNSEEAKANIISVCKLKGQNGNTAIGFGLYPKNKQPYGTDKGNTGRNMANIRAERQALDRLPGGALPFRGIEVIDEAYAEIPDVGKVDTSTGEIAEAEVVEVNEPTEATQEHLCQEHNCSYDRKVRGSSFWYAHELPEGGWCNEKKKKEQAPAPAPEAPRQEEAQTLPELSNPAQRKKIFATADQMGYKETDLKALVKQQFNVDHTTALTKKQASDLITMIEQGETTKPEGTAPEEVIEPDDIPY